MTTPSKSYKQVFYDLRPGKQVERRMIMDALGRLMNGGIPIRDYRYTGLGSIYFFDFILLYKLLGLRRFLSVEYDTDITKRVAFNKPFRPIEIRMAPIADVIPDLESTLRHLIWLDYDDRLTNSMLLDASAAANHLSRESLLLVTVDVEPPSEAETPEARAEYLEEQAGAFLPFDFDVEWCTQSRYPATNLAIISNAIATGLAVRSAGFLPLFRFIYADGHEMVTLGGMIGDDAVERRIDACDWSEACYLRRGDHDDPYRIRVPRLTRRERLLLDQHMPGDPRWRPREFELSGEELAAYREIHRFYPLYGELLA